MTDHPLITFAIFAYNQEQYIREAVEGAFAQTYSPLEIILSDDGSTDRTFEIMQTMAASYRGPHTIILNRNEPNLGLIEHVNKVVMELSHGEIVVFAAGDDISLPLRVSNVYEVFNLDNKIMSVSTDYQFIDSLGATLNKIKTFNSGSYSLNDFINNRTLPMSGCSRSYKREIFNTFGNLSRNCGVEDATLVFRSLLIGYSYHSNNICVKYRLCTNSMSSSLDMKHRKGIYKQRKKDANKAYLLNMLNKYEYNKIKSVIRTNLQKNIIIYKYINPKNSFLYFISKVIFNSNFNIYEKKLLLKNILKKIGVKFKVFI